jgi:hypothetical protein
MAKKPATPVEVDSDEQKRRQMLADDGWVPAGGGDAIIEWHPGDVVQGRYCGMRKGKYGMLIDIEVKRGVVETRSAPRVLQSRLEGLPRQAGINIKCDGKVPSEKGNDMWLFTVRSRDQIELPM